VDPAVRVALADPFSAAGLFSIAVLRAALAALVAEAMGSARRVALRVHPAHGVRCTRPALRRVAHLPARVLALGSDPAWEHVPASARVPAWVEGPEGWFRLPVRLRGRSARARMHGADGSSIRRPRKAR
jgi:hypothetical protein